jgi:hypothetical protein
VSWRKEKQQLPRAQSCRGGWMDSWVPGHGLASRSSRPGTYVRVASSLVQDITWTTIQQVRTVRGTALLRDPGQRGSRLRRRTRTACYSRQDVARVRATRSSAPARNNKFHPKKIDFVRIYTHERTQAREAHTTNCAFWWIRLRLDNGELGHRISTPPFGRAFS